MSDHAALIRRFYESFSHRDWAGMARCYHADVHFTDPVFDLRGSRARMMWRMLCTNGRDLSLEYRDIDAGQARGRAHWEARYTFSATGRTVLNIIDARFEFRDGLIVRHADSFDFWRWSRQALGLPGVLLGWSSLLQNKVRARAEQNLAAFAAMHADGSPAA